MYSINKIICIGEVLICFKENQKGYVINSYGLPANVCDYVSKLRGESPYLEELSNDYFSKVFTKTGIAFIKEDGGCDLTPDKSEIKPSAFIDCGILHFCLVCSVESPTKYTHMRSIEYHKGIISFDINIKEN